MVLVFVALSVFVQLARHVLGFAVNGCGFGSYGFRRREGESL